MMLRNRVLLGTTATMALLAAGTAGAQTINGGGSTLASPTYESAFVFYENSNPAADFSTYAMSGSGAAITAVLTNAANVTGGPTPFDFGASDATITDAQLNSSSTTTPGWNFSTTGKTPAGNLIQIPSIGTPITIPFDVAGVASNTAINLTDAQLCGLYSGKIINSNDQALSGSGIPQTNTPINIVYRSDNSGTTFLFTQHLAAVCTSSTSNLTFFATQTFANLFPLAPGSTTMHTLPSNFTGNSGSGGVQSTIDTTAESFGYLSPDYTREVAVPNGTTAKAPFVAEIGGVQPTPGNTSAALATGTPVLDPNVNTTMTAYNPADPVSFVPVAAAPTAGYPIVGFTTLLLPQCFADPSVAATLKAVISDITGSPGYATVIRANGFTPLPTALSGRISGAYLLTNTNASTINGAGVGGCAGHVGR